MQTGFTSTLNINLIRFIKSMFKTELKRAIAAGSVLLAMSISTNAQAVYDNVAGTFSWPVGNETFAAPSENLSDALVESYVKVGTDLTVITREYSFPEKDVKLMSYKPTTSNPGCVTDDMIEYKIKLKKGLTFTPTSVVFDAVKVGTDNAYFSWSYAVDGTPGDTIHYDDPKNQIRRNNNVNENAPLTHDEAINAEGQSGREFALRFYISSVANNKEMCIGGIKINGVVSGTEEVRLFKDFAIDFTSDPYTVTLPEDGVLPEGVTVEGTWHDAQHGYNTTTVTVPVDGPVRISLGLCQYGNGVATVKDTEGNLLTEINCGGACNGAAEWVYNSEDPTTLTITSASYIPFMSVAACELLPMINVSYYDTTGALLGTQTVQGGTPFELDFTEADVTVPEGQAFRGWFFSDQQTAAKFKEGSSLQDNTKLYARATNIEVPTSTSRFIYDLTKTYFYLEDHEAIEIDGKYYNNHGWLVDKGGAIKVNVAGKCYVTIGNCLYSAESTATVTDESGKTVAEFPVKAEADGAEYTFQYDGPAGWLTITFPEGSYTHSVAVWNVVDFVEYDETTGYFQIPASDVSSFLLALKSAAGIEGAKIFLPNGLYDMGETVLTGVSGKNISIIGESMEGTIIQNAPAKENEGISVTATLLNTSTDLYLQDLTVKNAMSFDGSTGRAVTIQDKGNRTICKNVNLHSYQDTYYSNNNSSYFYFEGGEIHGVTDYVCGGGDVYFNKVKFINEPIKDEVTMAAPNGAKNFGYVLNNCTIETISKRFNFGRSWGHFSGLTLLNTVINQPDKLIATRFITGGMNCAADSFKEYNSLDTLGNVITPDSNYLKFTHSTGDKEYETVLTAEEAAGYAIDKVFPDWDAAGIAAQKIATNVALKDGMLTWDAVEGSEAYAVVKDGAIVAIVTEPTYVVDDKDANWRVRAANGRGGFGPAIHADGSGVAGINAEEIVDVKYFNTQGLRVDESYRGVVVKVATTASGKTITSKIEK